MAFVVVKERENFAQKGNGRVLIHLQGKTDVAIFEALAKGLMESYRPFEAGAVGAGDGIDGQCLQLRDGCRHPLRSQEA